MSPPLKEAVEEATKKVQVILSELMPEDRFNGRFSEKNHPLLAEGKDVDVFSTMLFSANKRKYKNSVKIYSFTKLQTASTKSHNSCLSKHSNQELTLSGIMLTQENSFQIITSRGPVYGNLCEGAEPYLWLPYTRQLYLHQYENPLHPLGFP